MIFKNLVIIEGMEVISFIGEIELISTNGRIKEILLYENSKLKG